MLRLDDLRQKLTKIDGSGYKAYKSIQGSYDLGGCILFIDHVQADPFAPPSKIRLRVPMEEAAFPEYLYQGARLIALEDKIARITEKKIRFNSSQVKGTGKSGNVYIDAGGQEVLKRSAVKVTFDFVEARIAVGLPAAGRRIKGKEAEQILCVDMPAIAASSLYFKRLDENELKEHVFLYEDQEFIRNKLKQMGLVAFIGNGAVLPRISGNSNLPMPEEQTIKFVSPASMEVEIETLHHGTVKGMGIPEGVTLIVGGGYHGKTTLLKAIERGIYNHIAGDGREWVITVSDAVKIRAEDGRNVEKVDIRYFIDNLPFGQDTKEFSSVNASGSTSQAANIMEAIEIGAELLLLDEDTSATNFMIRDARMQRLVHKNKEPITPFIDRIRPLYEKHGISTILVIGGAGDYLDVADKVIMLDAYQVFDVTKEARFVAEEIKSSRQIETNGEFAGIKSRVISKESFNMLKREKTKVSARGVDSIALGKMTVELNAVEQLVDTSQTRAIAECLRYMTRYIDGKRSLHTIIDLVFRDINRDFEVISPFNPGHHPGDLALPRKYEVASALNRMRSLKIE